MKFCSSKVSCLLSRTLLSINKWITILSARARVSWALFVTAVFVFVSGAMDCSNPYVLRAIVVRLQRGHSHMKTNKTLRHSLGITVEFVRCATKETHTHTHTHTHLSIYIYTHTHTPLHTHTPPPHTHTRTHARTHPVTLAEYGYKTGIREKKKKNL